MFNYRLLKWACGCGLIAHSVNIGVTSDQKLIAVWKCKCGKKVTALEAFENMIANAPSPPAVESDSDFLSRAKIKWE